MAHVLVVEDEALIASLVEDALRDEGVDVAVASSGAEAVCRLHLEPRTFDAVVTDIDLGDEISGFEVGRVARVLHEHIKLVYVTGHPQNVAQARQEAVTFEKPFDVSALAARVRTLLRQ